MSDTLYVLAAAYDDVEDALAEYEAIKVAHRHVGSSHDFDATVIAKGEVADRVGAGVTRATRTVRATTTLSAEQLAAKIG
jgi:hypothetical protein